MAFEVELLAKNPTGVSLQKPYDIFTLTCLAYNKEDIDIPSSFVAENNSKGEGNIGLVENNYRRYK